MGPGSGHDVPAFDRFDLMQQAMGSVLGFCLNDTVAVDGLGPTRAHALDVRFIKAGMALRVHLLGHIESRGSGR